MWATQPTNWGGRKGPNGHIGGNTLLSADIPLEVRLVVLSPIDVPLVNSYVHLLRVSYVCLLTIVV